MFVRGQGVFDFVLGGGLIFVWVCMLLALASHVVMDRSALWFFARSRNRLLRPLYSLDMRAAAILPLLEVEEVEECITQRNHLQWRFQEHGRTFRVEAWFRAERKISTRFYSNKLVREEQIYLRVEIGELSRFFPRVRIVSHEPGTFAAQTTRLEELAASHTFEVEEEVDFSLTMWLVYDSPLLGESVIELDLEEQRALAASIAAMHGEHPSTALVTSSSSPGKWVHPGQFTEEKLCLFERVEDTLRIDFLLRVKAGGAPWHARELVSRALERCRRYANQFTIERSSGEEDFAQYVFRVVEHAELDASTKTVLLKIVLRLYQLRESTFYEEQMGRLEELVWRRQGSLELGELLPLMYASFLDRYDTSSLKMLAQRHIHEERLLNALIERTSKEEVLFDTELSWELREMVVVRMMRLKMSFMRQAEAWLAELEPEDAIALLGVILRRGWFAEIWQKPWMDTALEALMHRLDTARLHARLYHVLSSCRDTVPTQEASQEEGAHRLRSFELFEALLMRKYAVYLGFSDTFREDRARHLPLQALIQVMLRSRVRDYAHQGWQIVLNQLHEPSDLLGVFAYPGLHERHQLKVMVTMLEHETLEAMIRHNPSVRLTLLGLFEMASVTHRAIASEDFDRLATVLFTPDAGIFETPAQLSRQDAMLKLYIRLVEEQGVRTSALRALNIILEATRSSSRKSAELAAVVSAWQQALGSARPGIVGALSVSSAGKRGALSAVMDEESRE